MTTQDDASKSEGANPLGYSSRGVGLRGFESHPLHQTGYPLQAKRAVESSNE